jgi:hypothetical protein
MAMCLVVRSVWVVGEAGGQVVDVGGDVVADESHAVDAVDAALGGFDGFPGLDRRVGGFELGLGSDDDDEVGGVDQRVAELGGMVVADVDAEFGEGLRRPCRRDRTPSHLPGHRNHQNLNLTPGLHPSQASRPRHVSNPFAEPRSDGMDLEVDTIVDTNPTLLRSAARSTDCASLERSREDRI